MTVLWPRTNEWVITLMCRAGCQVDPVLHRHHVQLLTVEADVDELARIFGLAADIALRIGRQ